MALGQFGEVGSKLFGSLTDIAFIGIIALFVVGILGFLSYYFFIYRRRFDIEVNIKSSRALGGKIYGDWAAILTDRKNGTKFLRLLKDRVDLPAPPFFVLQPKGKSDYIEIYKKSDSDYAYLIPAKVTTSHVIGVNGKKYPVNKQEQNQIESDLYWIIKRKEENKKMLSPEGILMKLLEWGPQIISGVFMFMILWIFMTKLPEVINVLIELIKQLTELNQGGIIAG